MGPVGGGIRRPGLAQLGGGRARGLEVEDLIELRPAQGATTRYPFVTLEWSRQWPCEEVWKARKSS
jgi:hypothetical protein